MFNNNKLKLKIRFFRLKMNNNDYEIIEKEPSLQVSEEKTQSKEFETSVLSSNVQSENAKSDSNYNEISPFIEEKMQLKQENEGFIFQKEEVSGVFVEEFEGNKQRELFLMIFKGYYVITVCGLFGLFQIFVKIVAVCKGN